MSTIRFMQLEGNNVECEFHMENKALASYIYKYMANVSPYKAELIDKGEFKDKSSYSGRYNITVKYNKDLKYTDGYIDLFYMDSVCLALIEAIIASLENEQSEPQRWNFTITANMDYTFRPANTVPDRSNTIGDKEPVCIAVYYKPNEKDHSQIVGLFKLNSTDKELMSFIYKSMNLTYNNHIKLCKDFFMQDDGNYENKYKGNHSITLSVKHRDDDLEEPVLVLSGVNRGIVSFIKNAFTLYNTNDTFTINLSVFNFPISASERKENSNNHSITFLSKDNGDSESIKITGLDANFASFLYHNLTVASSQYVLERHNYKADYVEVSEENYVVFYKHYAIFKIRLNDEQFNHLLKILQSDSNKNWYVRTLYDKSWLHSHTMKQ